MRFRLIYLQLLEARGEREREATQRRVTEGIRLVDQAGPRRAGTGARLGIVAAVAGERGQVAADDARGPIAEQTFELTDVIGEARLTDLRERTLLDAVVRRAKHVVEATGATRLGRTNAPAVARGLRRLD